jgi:hypothetical protein
VRLGERGDASRERLPEFGQTERRAQAGIEHGLHGGERILYPMVELAHQ